MRSGINSDLIGYYGDLAPIFKKNENHNFIAPSTIAICVGNELLRQYMGEIAKLSNPHPALTTDNIVAQLKAEYVETLKFLRNLNPEATIILVSPPYYGVANTSINHLLTLQRSIYARVIRELEADDLKEVIIADMTSSINPFDKSNYVNLSNLNAVGGKKVERALTKLMLNPTVKKGKVYSFYPDFLANDDSPQLLGEDYNEYSIQEWLIADPDDLKAGYTYQELALYKEYHFENRNFLTITLELLGKFKDAIDKLPAASSLREPALQVYKCSDAFSSQMKNPEEYKSWAISMILALKVLDNPDNEIFVNRLRDNAMHRAIQKTNYAQYFVAALTTLAGCALLAITALTMPLTLTVSTVCLAATGSLVSATGLTLFCRNPPLTNKDNFINLAEETRNQIIARRW
jgi:hypothetical protein